jgi:hypothetical protein
MHWVYESINSFWEGLNQAERIGYVLMSVSGSALIYDGLEFVCGFFRKKDPGGLEKLNE